MEDGSMEPFMGQIALFPYNFAPNGWAACEGQFLPISQDTALFSLIGTTFGMASEDHDLVFTNAHGKYIPPKLLFLSLLIIFFIVFLLPRLRL